MRVPVGVSRVRVIRLENESASVLRTPSTAIPISSAISMALTMLTSWSVQFCSRAARPQTVSGVQSNRASLPL